MKVDGKQENDMEAATIWMYPIESATQFLHELKGMNDECRYCPACEDWGQPQGQE